MRVAALFDVHGNLPALEAVLAEPDVGAADLVVCGGDTVSGPMPRESIALLRDLGDRLRYVHGNGERAVVAAAGAEPSDDELLEQARWCAAQLDAETLGFLAGLPPTVRIGDTLVCHATPRSDEEIVTLVTSPERLRRVFAGVDAALVVGGHTHSQMERHVDGLRYVNAGSVGMPYEHEPGAYWALIAPEAELRRTEYDLEAAAERIRATDFPAAAEFADEYVLSRHSPDETAPFFERLAASR
jgi:predicted phosphodiesterase